MLWIEDEAGNVSHDYEGAIEIAQLPARLGYNPAEYALCRFYYQADNEMAYIREALRWCRKAYDHREQASIYLAHMYLLGGDGVLPDYQLARRYFEIGANIGIVSAAEGLAGIYREGLGVPVSHTDALMWLEIALQWKSDEKYAIEYEVQRLTYQIAQLTENMEMHEISRAQIRAAEWMAEYEERRGR